MRNARVDAFALERKRDTQRTKFYLYPFLFEIFLFETRNVECLNNREKKSISSSDGTQHVRHTY